MVKFFCLFFAFMFAKGKTATERQKVLFRYIAGIFVFAAVALIVWFYKEDIFKKDEKLKRGENLANLPTNLTPNLPSNFDVPHAKPENLAPVEVVEEQISLEQQFWNGIQEIPCFKEFFEKNGVTKIEKVERGFSDFSVGEDDVKLCLKFLKDHLLIMTDDEFKNNMKIYDEFKEFWENTIDSKIMRSVKKSQYFDINSGHVIPGFFRDYFGFGIKITIKVNNEAEKEMFFGGNNFFDYLLKSEKNRELLLKEKAAEFFWILFDYKCKFGESCSLKLPKIDVIFGNKTKLMLHEFLNFVESGKDQFFEDLKSIKDDQVVEFLPNSQIKIRAKTVDDDSKTRIILTGMKNGAERTITAVIF